MLERLRQLQREEKEQLRLKSERRSVAQMKLKEVRRECLEASGILDIMKKLRRLIPGSEIVVDDALDNYALDSGFPPKVRALLRWKHEEIVYSEIGQQDTHTTWSGLEVTATVGDERISIRFINKDYSPSLERATRGSDGHSPSPCYELSRQEWRDREKLEQTFAQILFEAGVRLPEEKS